MYEPKTDEHTHPFLARFAREAAPGGMRGLTRFTKVDRETTDDQTAEAFAGPPADPPATIFTAVERETTDDR